MKPNQSNCSNCNKVIYRPPSRIKKYNHYYCNRLCYLTALKKDESLSANYKGRNKNFICKHCGNEFIRRQHGDIIPQYCSLKCWGKNRDIKGEKHWNWKGGKDTRYIKKTAPRPRPKICEVCGQEGKRRNGIVLDHNHKTGKFRGWLCSNCNTAIGLLNEDPKRFELLIKYITNNENSL